MMKYQGMVNDCSTSLLCFREACVSSIENIQDGIMFYEENELFEAISCLSKNSEKIAKMTEQTNALIRKTAELSSLAKEAILEATKDKNISDKHRKEFDDRIKELKRDELEQIARREGLEEIIARQELTIEQAIRRADREANHEHSIAMLNAITEPANQAFKAFGAAMSNAGAEIKSFSSSTKKMLTKMIKKLESVSFDEVENPTLAFESTMRDLDEAKEKALNSDERMEEEIENIEKKRSEIRVEYEKTQAQAMEKADIEKIEQTRGSSALYEIVSQKEQKLHEDRMALIRLNANLKKQTEELQQKFETMSDVKRAIEMLSMAMKVLAKIRTTLEHLKGFWEMQKLQCEALKENSEKQIEDMQKIQERGNKRRTAFEKRLRQSIRDAITKWMTLYKLNANAFVAIRESQEVIDDAVCSFGQIDEKTMKMRTPEQIQDLMKNLLKEFNTAQDEANMITED